MPGEHHRAAAVHWALRAYAILLVAGLAMSEFVVGVCIGLALGIALDQLVLAPLSRLLARRGERL